MADIIIEKISQSHIKLICEQSIIRELSDKFTFDVPNARFSPAYKKKHWDGKIRLLNIRNNTLFAGLIHNIAEYAEENNHTIQDKTNLLITENFSIAEAKEFVSTLSLPLEVRDYQLRALALAIRHKRCVLVSPTASGKSLIAYMIAKYYNKKTLVVVPTISLVSQMTKDFKDYGYEKNIHGVIGGVEKSTDLAITVSTWQSVYEQQESFFKDFEVIIGDEAHLFKAKSLTSIMSKMKNTPYRIGMTGTLDGAEVNELVLTGLFGKIEKIVDTSKLISSGTLADLQIKVLLLKHDKSVTSSLTGRGYQKEIEYIISSESRNRFIKNLAISLPGNTLILFAFVEKHGKILYNMIKESKSNNTFFVSGEVESEDREEIRARIETLNDSIVVASYGVFSTGINIKRLHNIIFASPSKSRIRVLQSIGRGLRKDSDKDRCKLFDIADDLSHRDKKNFTLLHLIERIKMYNNEEFPYEIHTINIRERSNGTNNLFKTT